MLFMMCQTKDHGEVFLTCYGLNFIALHVISMCCMRGTCLVAHNSGGITVINDTELHQPACELMSYLI